jgi:hypothetical protein
MQSQSKILVELCPVNVCFAMQSLYLFSLTDWALNFLQRQLLPLTQWIKTKAVALRCLQEVRCYNFAFSIRYSENNLVKFYKWPGLLGFSTGDSDIDMEASTDGI